MSQNPGLDANIAWFAVLLMGLLMLLQSIVVFILFTKTGKQLRASQPRLSAFLAHIQSGTAALRQLLSHVEGVPAKLVEVEGQTPALLFTLTDLVKGLDRRVAAFADRSRFYLHQFDKAADSVLSNFSTQTFRVHRAVIHPAVRFSTLLRSFSSIASRLFEENESPATYSSDQESFI